MVEGAGGAQREVVPVLAAGIGMLPARAKLPQHFALERANHRDVVRLVSDVRDVPGNLEAMGALELTAAPGMQEVAVRIEHEHRGVLALEDVETVAEIRRDPA